MNPYASTPRLSKGILQQHIVSESNSHLSSIIQQMVEASPLPLDEISNAPGSVRHHICRPSHRDKATNTLSETLLFYIYQTTRHGPQNGFRLCMIHRGYCVGPSDQPNSNEEDDVDLLEKPIPQGHVELCILGLRPTSISKDSEP
ncbi:uncharacterized protein F4822DRAFT_48281 [Hypoxylon trugodes]|uniref:uncharacterized protein n=1 Tax=Hypoxylon trugodes TaxID=326681 RepID=UPI00219B73C6|nr:uncharacterized protein F4822DRAFT_48281 [Hypoxylon trugodes]KAI1394462.1 hypothetical protein F4822DRAFT_48281 [Hypoxylon trugodes]